ncbi:MAG: hypothetical protein OEX07_00945 [Gammaproteobacteria bacterium]|nr:hypothetical protein [Gammaproteobacteria bacterium]
MGISSGKWSELEHMETARSHAPVVTYKNQLYVFGGGGPDFKSLNSCICYNPESNSWKNIANMPTKRSGTAAFLVGSLIYVIGGGYKKPDGNFQFLKTVEVYDPESDSWSSAPDMLQPHDYPAAALVGDTIYIIGGHHPEACLGGPKTDPGFSFCERWSPSQASWEQIADLPTPRFAASALTREDKIYTSGGVAFTPEGFNNFDFFETYSTKENLWYKDDSIKLPWQAAGQGMCSVDDNFFFMGGYSTDNIHPRASVHLATDNQWHALPDMPLPRAAMGVANLNNTIFLIGGWADDGRTPLNSVVAYHWK